MSNSPFDSAPVTDLRKYVQWFDNAMSAEFCTQMIAAFGAMNGFHSANGRGHRAGLEESAWTELNITPHADDAFKGFFYDQIDRYFARYNESLQLSVAIPLRPKTEDLRIKRYRAGGEEMFQPHFDSVDEKANRYLVFLWYLNDVAEGGETQFTNIGTKVEARAGRLLIFPPYWMFQHAGLAPRSNDKYIVSTYLLF